MEYPRTVFIFAFQDLIDLVGVAVQMISLAAPMYLCIYTRIDDFLQVQDKLHSGCAIWAHALGIV